MTNRLANVYHLVQKDNSKYEVMAPNLISMLFFFFNLIRPQIINVWNKNLKGDVQFE